MAEKRYIFDDFVLEPGNRSLTRSGEVVSLSGRYFDALTLLVTEAGQLVTKTRFMEDIWGGAAVTDEALTQCVRALRRTLGDAAGQPRFIETVPGHGYRFIAIVDTPSIHSSNSTALWTIPSFVSGHWPGVTAGGMLAGLTGGLIYGFVLSESFNNAGLGTISALLVVTIVCAGVGLLAGFGVGLGLSLARLFPGPLIFGRLAGAALGGFLVGTLTKLIGVDALTLLFGIGLPGMTGGGEGLLLGGAAGLAAHITLSAAKPMKALLAGILAGLAAGIVIHLLGGRLMSGSLDLLVQGTPGARLDFEALGALTGEDGFGPISRGMATIFEAVLFTTAIAAALRLKPFRKTSG